MSKKRYRKHSWFQRNINRRRELIMLWFALISTAVFIVIGMALAVYLESLHPGWFSAVGY
jgi:hypothetical protein